MHVVFALEAEEDLDAVGLQLSRLSELAAVRVLSRIVEACLSLRTLPRRHPLEPLDPAGRLRRFNFERYVILYDVDDLRVEIVRILPGEMDVDKLFSR